MFIEIADDFWLNSAYVKYFYPHKNGNAYAVFDRVYGSDGVLVGNDEILIGCFDSREEAKAYIDELVAKINADNTKR